MYARNKKGKIIELELIKQEKEKDLYLIIGIILIIIGIGNIILLGVFISGLL